MARAYALALFTFLFCMAISLMNATTMFGTMAHATPPVNPGDYNQQTFNETQAALQPPSQTTGGITNPFSSVWNVVQGFGVAVKVLSQATIGFEMMLNQPPFNLPWSMLIIVLAIRIFIYGWWLVSLIMFRYFGE
jgi:hypothetical protein